MADYYTNGIGRRTKRKGKRPSGKQLSLLLLDALMTLAVVVLVFLTVTAIIVQYISPEKSGILSIISLGIPVIYLLDIVTMFYWVVRWRWYRATVMIATVVMGLFYLARYYKLDLDRHYDTSYVERRYTKVISYNVRMGKSEGFVDYIKEQNADILCLQEMAPTSENWIALTEDYRTTKSKENTSDNQILAKHRILRSGAIEGLPYRKAVWADIKIKEDTVRVVSLHLKSTSISAADTQFIEQHEYLLDKQRTEKLRSIISRLVENNRKRGVQAEIVAEFVKQSPHTTIVCGDFNDVPLSYTYNLIAKDLTDTFSKCATGFDYTFNTRYGVLRIDNILVSPSVEVVSYEVDYDCNFSDHYPVISRIKLNSNR